MMQELRCQYYAVNRSGHESSDRLPRLTPNLYLLPTVRPWGSTVTPLRLLKSGLINGIVHLGLIGLRGPFTFLIPQALLFA